jgi:hypothetical protein
MIQNKYHYNTPIVTLSRKWSTTHHDSGMERWPGASTILHMLGFTRMIDYEA